jgi:hypothetical protein
MHPMTAEQHGHANGALPMNAAGPAVAGESSAPSQPSLALRMAQRGFAPLLETGVRHTTFRFAQLRGGARRALSGLSADDRVHLARWLALLCASAGHGARESVESRLVRVDALLAAAVLALLATLSDGPASHGAVAA